MNRIYIILAVAMVTVLGCSTTDKLSRGGRTVERRAEVAEAVQSGSYVIRMNHMTGKFGLRADLRPSHNFIVIRNNQVARISLGYLGRSYDIMQITGINMEGQITESSYDIKKNGMYKISMRVTENNETFDLNINIGRDGYCDVGIIHPKIDYVSYRGELRKPGR